MKIIYQDGYIHNLGIQNEPNKPMFGWLFYKHPNGDWTSLADLKDEMSIFLLPPSCEKEPKE